MEIKPEDLELSKTNNPFAKFKNSAGEDASPELMARIAHLHSLNYPLYDIGLALNIPYDRINMWSQENPVFKEMLEAARKVKLGRLEAVMWDQATNGFTKPVISGGRVIMDPTNNTKIMHETVFDVRQQEFMAKAHDRERYGDKVQTDANINLRSDQAKAELDAAIEKAIAADEAAAQASGTEPQS